MLRNSILRLPRCGLSLLADSAVVRTAAVNKVPNRDDYLWHLLGHLKETPQQRSSNENACWSFYGMIVFLLYPGSHNNGGVIISDTEASLAEYLMKNMKSRDGKPLLTNIISAQMLQMSKDIAMSFPEKTLICPEGYNIGVLRPKDAEFIHTFWNKSLLDSTKDSIKAFQFMIGSLPNSAIFDTSDPENPVAWVLTAPEAILGTVSLWRQLLVSPTLSNTVVAVAIDEAHCVFKWMRDDIIDKLDMAGCCVVSESPNKPNIYYEVVRRKTIEEDFA
ncbi:hypothetical protein EMCRGX_G026734 [Ephydatia muelleri]